MHHRSRSLGFVVVVALSVTSVDARDFHVATTGDDTNPGASESPLRTIQKAVGEARAGDTVLVHGGTYKEHVVLHFSGEPEKPIALKNAPGERPILDGEGRGRIELKSLSGQAAAT